MVLLLPHTVQDKSNAAGRTSLLMMSQITSNLRS